MNGIISAKKLARLLDRKPEPTVTLADKDISDPPTLKQILSGIIRDVATLQGLWRPRRLDFEGLVANGSVGTPSDIRVVHNFGAPVRWWVVDVTAPIVVTLPYIYRVSSDLNSLTLRTYFQSTLTVRVEEVG